MNVLILVVDDEPDMEPLFRQHFRRELRAERFSMSFATSGEQALERVASADGKSLILVLSDINMPGMTGLDLIPRIKQNMPDLPIVMITAYADPVTEKRALERGAEHVFAKPIDFAALKADIDLRIAARERGV